MSTARSTAQNYRIGFAPRMQGVMQIASLNGQRMDSKIAPIELLSADADGIRFRSDLKLPVGGQVVWRFQFHGDSRHSAEGVLVAAAGEAGGYEYEAAWLDGEKARSSLLESLFVYGELQYILFQAMRSYVNQDSPGAQRHTINLLG